MLVLHIRVIRPAAAFRRHPVDVLGGILDIAGFAVDAVLGVDLQARLAAICLAHDFVDAGRTVALLGRVIEGQVDLDRDLGVL